MSEVDAELKSSARQVCREPGSQWQGAVHMLLRWMESVRMAIVRRVYTVDMKNTVNKDEKQDDKSTMMIAQQ